MEYFVGDWIKVRTNHDYSLIFDVDFYDSRYLHFGVIELEIIAVHEDIWYVVEAPATVTEDTVLVNKSRLKKWKLLPSMLDRQISLISEKAVGGRRKFDPYVNALSCKLCQEIFPYAPANQPDGTLICWSCRSTKNYLINPG